MTKLVGEIKELMERIQGEMDRAMNGNKSAGRRARVMSKDLERMFGRYRKESVSAEKQQPGETP